MHIWNICIIFELLLIINQTTMNGLQLFALMQNQVTELKFGHPLANNVNGIKKQFKEAFGLSLRASNKDVLQAIGIVYKENGMASKFNDYMLKHKMVEKFGIELV